MKGLTGESYALMRIMFGLNFCFHGTQKLLAFPVPMPMEPPPAITWAAGSIEMVGGLLVAIGLQTRWAAFVCSGMMAVAYWVAHGTKHLFPMVNQGELAVLFCFAFLFMAAYGGGKWSVDGLRGR